MHSGSRRLLYLVGQLGLGGQERQLCYLLRALDRERYLPAVAVWDSSSADVYTEEISRLGIPIYNFPEHMSRPAKLRYLRTLVTNLNPEVLHSYSFFTNFPAWWASLGTRTLSIGSIRNNFINDCRLAGRVVGALSAGWPGNQICNSAAAQRAAANARWPFKPIRLQLVRNGIDIDGFMPSSRLPIRPSVLAIGRLFPEKRWDRLVTAVGLVAAEGRSFCVRLAGTGPLLNSLREQARRVGVEHLIEFLGARRDVQQLLAESQFLVHTAEEEGCPNVVMEAMACGRPVVAMQAGDISCLVEEGHTGFVVEQEDERALAIRIGQLLSDQPLCWRMGQAARAKAEREFSLKRLVAETLNAYRAVGWCDGHPAQ